MRRILLSPAAPARLLLALAAACALAPAAAAQTPAGSVSGLVVDAASRLPVPDASVAIEPRAAGAFPPTAGAGSAWVQATRAVRTDSLGRYAFRGLAPGEYRLLVSRVGYRAAALEVELRSAVDSRVSVGLQMEPISLHPVEARARAAAAEPADPYGRAARTQGGDEAGEARLAAERHRQRAYVAGDVRAVTHADVEEGITLVETDLFRALQKLPGVAARDDYTAEIGPRGAPGDHTAVYFDGLPLFGALHAMGIFSAVNPDVVGAAFLHPGVQPAALGGGGAASLEVRTRPGGRQGRLAGVGELSAVSARAALDGPTADGEGGWLAGLRRSHADLLFLALNASAERPGHFTDLSGRWDHPLRGGARLEASGLAQEGWFGRGTSNLLGSGAERSGSLAARATLDTPWRGMRLRQTLGFSGRLLRFGVHDQEGAGGLAWAREWTTSTVHHLALSGELRPAASAAGSTWAAGYQLTHQGAGLDGIRPTLFVPADVEPWRADTRDGLALGALWGEYRWSPSDALALSAGVRVEGGEAVRGGGSVRAAPRLSARWRPGGGVSLTAGAGRTYQYLQSAFPGGVLPAPRFRSERVWVLAGRDVPVLRADVATLGAEAWLGGAWLAGVTAYARRTAGVVLPDPRPGPLLAARPAWVEGENDARGVEVSVRKLAGSWTASLAYAHGVSEVSAAGLVFPSAADREHVLDVSAMARVSRGWRLGAAFAAESGTPFTRVFGGTGLCEPPTDCAPRAEAPNAARARPFASLDLLADWSRQYERWGLNVYLQVRNAFNRANAGRYEGSYVDCPLGCGVGDEFWQGVPLFPVVGVRAWF